MRFSSKVFAVTVMALLPFAAAAAEEPGVYHRVMMKGSLLEVTGDGAYVCIGSSEGAAVGQEFDVFRYSRDTSGGPKAGVHFKREKVGRIQLKEITDEHYAHAKVIKGSLRAGDMAELEREDR
jgi:hypothetical protein